MLRIDLRRNERPLLMTGVILLALFFSFLAWSDRNQRDSLWQQQLHAQSEIQRMAVEQSQQALRRQALMAANSLAQDPDTLRLIRRIAVLNERNGLDDPVLHLLRAQLRDDLSGFWRILEEAGANQLHVHLAPGAISLLRMHQPDLWGDSLVGVRPMVELVQAQGQALSGMETGRHGSGMRGIVPITNKAGPGGNVIASLEVGFGMLPELQLLDDELQAGLTLLLNRQLLEDVVLDHDGAGLVDLKGSPWWLNQSSRNEAMDWLSSDSVTQALQQDGSAELTLNGRYHLLTSVPLKDFQSRLDGQGNPSALVLVWRDISSLWQQHLAEKNRALLTWLTAFIAAMLLLGALLLATRESVRRREHDHQGRLKQEIKEREQTAQLLDIVSQTQSAYIKASNLNDSFDQLLAQILELTGSRFGFVGQLLRDGDGKPFLQTYAISNIAWDDQSRAFYEEHRATGLRFTRLDTLFGQVLQNGTAYISNDPVNDPHRGGLPPGHPALESFAGLPILFGDQMVGMIGLANREAGYTLEQLAYLTPLLNSLGQLIHALRRDEEERASARRIELQRKALRALNEIAALPNLRLETRLNKALELGCQYLRMDVGIISSITDDDYRVVAQYSPDNNIAIGQYFTLGSTYCALTLQQSDVLAIEFMGQSRFSGHPCYSLFGLESYVGVPLIVDGERYGTLNFTSGEPRQQPFADTDLEFIRLMSRWVNSALSQDAANREREQLLERFNRLTEQLPGVVYQYQLNSDGQTWFPYSSQGIVDVYGVTPEQVRLDAATAVQAIHPDDRPHILDGIADSAKHLSIWRSEYRVNHPVLGEIWAAGSAVPERLENGDTIWHGYIGDITARKQIELTLEHERARLESIIRGTNIGTWEWNVNTGETLFNERWANIIGYTLDELAPINIDTWGRLTHPDDLAESERKLKQHFSGEADYYDCKCRMRHKDGHWVWVHDRGQLISRTPEGKPLWMSGTHADISAEMDRDQKISQARAFLRAVIDAATEVAVITTDLQGTITLFNSGAEKLLGYRAEDIIDRTTPAIFHLASELERRGQKLSQEKGFEVSGFEVFTSNVRTGGGETLPWTYVHKDGSHRLVNLTVTGIREENNELSGFLGIATDITDLIQTTRALQKSESRFRSMVSNLPGAVYRCSNDRDWTMSYLSDEIQTITGYPASDFVNNRVRSYASIVHPEDLHLTYAVGKQIQRQEAFETTYRVVHAQGHEVWVREKGRGEYNAQNELLWLSGFIWDATEQHRIDQLKSQFVSTVSHELRTPLTSITGALALINNGVLGEVPVSMRKLLDIAHSNSTQLNKLINDLLDMDKLGAGKMHFNLQSQPLAPLLLKAIDNNSSYAAQFQITLELGQVDPVEVTVDALRLGQILNNFLSNAIKFSHPGQTVRLDAHYAEGRVRITVTDKGLGIAADFHDRIFNKFSQADATDTRQRGGTGLGLAICKELAENMDAELGFESEAGQGSRFWCLLDAEPIEEDKT
jgi:PAS domain S-box-containing protein